MNRPPREMISHGVIAIVLCAGAYVGLVEPLHHDLQEARATRASLSDRAATIDTLESRRGVLAERVAEAERDLVGLRELGVVDADAGLTHQRVVACAERHGATVERVKRGQTRDARPAGARESSEGAPPLLPMVSEFESVMAGPFEGALRVLDGIERTVGASRIVRGMIIRDADAGPDHVTLRLTTEHLSVMMSDGASNGEGSP